MRSEITERLLAVAGSDTSHEAAKTMRVGSARLRAMVHLALVESGEQGMTDEEIQDWLEMNPSTQRPRRVELCSMGIVRDSGRRRRTRSGRTAVVWELASREDEVRSPLLCGEETR